MNAEHLEFLQIGPRIARIRKGLEMTQEQLCEEMGTSQQVISRYEQDTSGNLSLKKVLELAEAMGVDYKLLLRTGDAPPPALPQRSEKAVNKVMSELFSMGDENLQRVYKLLTVYFTDNA